MRSSGITLKKSLGQHFLQDENICRKIISALRERPFHQLLEVGPGAGALTKYILEMGDIKFRTIEVDAEKVDYLQRNFPLLRDRIIHQDFLESNKPFEGRFTVVGNFPYNISSQILFKILEWKEDVECVIGMFQKEVAQRIAAREGNKVYGVLSVLVQAFYDVQFLFEVHEQSFYPPPRVKSAVIRLLPRKDTPHMRTEKDFFRLVKTAFNQRRKTLRNAVKELFDPETLRSDIFDKRAEQLKVEDFARLTFAMKP
ncbi:MAG TPA: 16S rRNA (adenine(1518)-N(6)/adenine(1519)-N(6))-dimethyltransferase RsmA [Puia sp.]|nr:16S rRNA (adenine(1518)-N(6)/adenine(1519)-N(6))-dimethyltransferase RsmA [Puia sp.]